MRSYVGGLFVKLEMIALFAVMLLKLVQNGVRNEFVVATISPDMIGQQ